MKPISKRIAISCILAASCLPCVSAPSMQLQSNLLAPPREHASAVSASDLRALTEAPAGIAPDDSLYADAMRAIHENRWDDAASLFLRAAQMHAGHAEGALYWAAYSENKQGHGDRALATCADLRKAFPSSRWLEECGALEIEIRSANGDPIDPSTQQDQQLKLLALNSMMKKDESRALPQIQQMLQGDQPESFKEKALFILAQSPSSKARQMLSDVSNSTANPVLQAKARQMLATLHSNPANSGTTARDRRISLDVTVTDATGKPVTGLKAEDLTVLDNGKPTPLTSFRPVGDSSAAQTSSEAISEVMVLIDTVNVSLADIAYERSQVDAMLHTNGGKLPYPLSVLLFNGNGAERVSPVSQDGNAIATQLSQLPGNLHIIRHSAGMYGAEERAGLSLKTLSTLITEEGSHPGKKLILWISPGWPLLPYADDWSSSREDRINFTEIVALSTALRQARIVLYCIDPPRTSGGNSTEWFLYKEYLKPVRKQRDATVGNLGLQVLAEQSGGQAVNSTNRYLAEELQHIIASAGPGYLLAFDAPPAHQADEYHDLKVTINHPGLTVRTRAGYYNQP
jgi:VWFA-related protein